MPLSLPSTLQKPECGDWVEPAQGVGDERSHGWPVGIAATQTPQIDGDIGAPPSEAIADGGIAQNALAHCASTPHAAPFGSVPAGGSHAPTTAEPSRPHEAMAPLICVAHADSDAS
jgi:hypothetical protein